MNRDYNSNVTCLPGTMVSKARPETTSNRYSRKHMSSDIFNCGSNSNSNNGYGNSFKMSNKKVVNSVFNQSMQEKNLIPHPRAHRPNQIRDVFTSQIALV